MIMFPTTQQVRRAFLFAATKNDVSIVASKTRDNPPLWHLPYPEFQDVRGINKRLTRKICYDFHFTEKSQYYEMLDDASAYLSLCSKKLFIDRNAKTLYSEKQKSMFVYCVIK